MNYSSIVHCFSLLLDGERWKQVDIPPEMQSIVERFETGFISVVFTLFVPDSLI